MDCYGGLWGVTQDTPTTCQGIPTQSHNIGGAMDSVFCIAVLKLGGAGSGASMDGRSISIHGQTPRYSALEWNITFLFLGELFIIS